MQNPIQIPKALLVFTTILLLLNGSSGDPRAQTVQIMCGNDRHNNASIYVPNFVATMERISEQMQTVGSGLAVIASGLDTNYGLAQCYGDLSLRDCVLCYAEARTVLPQCFPYNGGRIYLDGCFMRAENFNFFEEYRGSLDRAVCGNTSRKNSGFQETARRSVLEAVSNASNNNNYARIESAVSGTAKESVYVLANCWRTLSESTCRLCLENASASLLSCLPWNEGRALHTGCFMRYSDINFLNPILRSTEGNLRATGNNRRIIYVASATSAAAIIILGLLVILCIRRNKGRRKEVLKKKGTREEWSETSESHKENLELPLFEYATIAKATNNFSNDHKLGEGGFGPVYKGILEDGQEIAVKKLSKSSRQGVDEFKNEVLCIAKLQHRNLVKLLGCCIYVEKILVYEYMPNKSLDYFIFDERQSSLLDWDKLFKIINGISRGLLYLHQDSRLRIIHRDLKASNILLDYEMNPKISDFGMARSFRDHETEANTNRVVGTYGYMSPEYAIDGLFSMKSDVFSFGVLVLEIVSGKKNRGFIHQDHSRNLLGHAWNLHNEGRDMELVNGCIRDSCNEFEALRSIHVALLCVQQSPEDRPSMSTVVLMLSSDAELPQPKLPGFYGERILLSDGNSSQYDCPSVNEMTDTIIDPR